MLRPNVGVVFLMPRHSLVNARRAAKQMGFTPVGNKWQTNTYKNICVFDLTNKTVEVTPCKIDRITENNKRFSIYSLRFHGMLWYYSKRSRPRYKTTEQIISEIVAGSIENDHV